MAVVSDIEVEVECTIVVSVMTEVFVSVTVNLLRGRCCRCWIHFNLWRKIEGGLSGLAAVDESVMEFEISRW